MIHNEKEYREAVGRLAEESIRLVECRARLRERGLATDEIKRVVDPMKSFHLQLKEEVESYGRLERRECAEETTGSGPLVPTVSNRARCCDRRCRERRTATGRRAKPAAMWWRCSNDQTQADCPSSPRSASGGCCKTRSPSCGDRRR